MFDYYYIKYVIVVISRRALQSEQNGIIIIKTIYFTSPYLLKMKISQSVDVDIMIFPTWCCYCSSYWSAGPHTTVTPV